MGKAFIDRVDDLSAKEENGVVTEIARRARVVRLNATDYTVLFQALEQAGIPLPGAGLPGTSLVLAGRHPRLVAEDPTKVDVDLIYKQLIDNQNLGAGGTLYGRTRCSVAEKATNFYIPQGPRSGNTPVQIIVQHTFPPNDPDYPGETIQQGGEIRVMVPGANTSLDGYYDTNDPWSIANYLISSINNAAWMSQPALCWMCTEVGFQIIGVAPSGNKARYKFNFEFQCDLDTWQPSVVFNDSRNNKPPPNLIEGIGYLAIPYYNELNFDRVFGSYFEGYQVF